MNMKTRYAMSTIIISVNVMMFRIYCRNSGTVNAHTDGNGAWKDGPTAVVILTYYRSGSTFLGDIINQSKDVFYVFEPLFYLTHVSTLNYYNRSKRKSKLALLEGKETIKSILTCQLTKLPLEFWKGLPFVSFQGRQLQVFNNKTNTKVQKMGRYHFLRKNTDFYRNLSNLQGECKKAKKVVIKTIRFPMLGLSDLVSRMGKVKIIHLLRDPRPTVLSQIIRTTQQDFRKYTKDFCNRVLSDLSTADLFNVLFPTTNVIRIRYEHFASHPVDMTQVLFKYLNLNLTNDIINTVKEMTSANKTEKEMEQIGMARKKPNSTQEINKWRRFARFKNVKVIDRECSILYEKVGYLPIYSIKMLRDKSEFVFKDVQSNINNHEYSTDNNFPSGFITRELGYK